MKKLVLIAALLTAQISYAQEAQETNQELDTKVQKLSDDIKKLTEIIKANQADAKSSVGRISLHSKTVKVYTDGSSTSTDTKVDTVIVISKDGSIYDLRIMCSNKQVFTNVRAPIAFGDRINSTTEKLYVDKDSKDYIIIGSVLNYYSFKPFLPSDTSFLLIADKKETVHLSRGVGINSIFDVRLYTDALGVFSEEDNGLIQTDMRFKQILHRSNIPNTGVFVLQYFKLNLSFSKFDSKVATVNSSDFSRSNLYQKSFFNGEFAFNVANIWVPRKSFNSIFLDIGVGVSAAKFKDGTDSTTVNSPYWFLELGGDFRIADNVGSNLSIKGIGSYATQIDLTDEGGYRFFVKPTVEVFWNPEGNKASRIFGRLSYVVDPDQTSENFIQLQLGYAMNITELAKK